MRQIVSRGIHLSRIGIGPVGLVWFAFLIMLPWIPPFNQEYLLRWLIGAALIAAQAVAFDFTTGLINIVNFGFAAFVGLGAYTSALMNIHFGIPIWLSMIIGALMSGLLGLFTGMLTLRLRGIYAAIMTWFVALALAGLARNLVDLTRGSLGLSTPPLLENVSNRPYYFIILGMLAITFLILNAFSKSHIGLAFRAIGQNMDAARASGINPIKYRILNFTLSCLFAGWLGGFYAHYIGILTPQAMGTARTVEILAVAYLGGRGSLWGGAVVAFPFILFVEWLRSTFSVLSGLHLVLYGVILILVMIYYPGGFASVYSNIRAYVFNIIRRPKTTVDYTRRNI